MTRHPDAPPLAKSDLTGRLELDGLRLPGRLVDGRAEAGSSCLVWQPLGSDTASALKPGVSGRIIYREPPPPAPPRRATRRIRRRVMIGVNAAGTAAAGVGGMVVRFAQALAENRRAEPPSTTEERRSLYLRDGDVIPSVITKIDAEGVWFKTSLSKSTFVAHAKVKAVELASEPSDGSDKVVLSKSKKERLLTLPRMQKADPPTHLIRSKNGDYLRGRVTKMDDKTLEVESGSKTRRCRATGFRGSSGCTPTSSMRPRNPLRNRLGRPFHARAGGAQRRRSAHVSGRSVRRHDALRQERRPGSVPGGREPDGPALDRQSPSIRWPRQLAYQQWKLKNAPEPKYVTAGDGADGAAATRARNRRWWASRPPISPSTSWGARRFTLPTARARKWSCSTSGPPGAALACKRCRRSSGRSAQFKDQNVRLVAVNLQETAEQVTALLERQKLHVTVALDRDGVVADKYKAVAIPQTVIIGRDGNVARLFVGGGPHLEEQLKEAIKAVLERRQADKNPKK